MTLPSDYSFKVMHGYSTRVLNSPYCGNSVVTLHFNSFVESLNLFFNLPRMLQVLTIRVILLEIEFICPVGIEFVILAQNFVRIKIGSWSKHEKGCISCVMIKCKHKLGT